MNKDGLNKLLKKLETIPSQEKMCNKPHHRSNKYTFYISKEHDDFLETFAKKCNTSKTSLIEYAIDLFLESYGRLFDKEKLNKLDSTIDALNKKLNYEINYCRVDIIRVAIKLYIHFLKEHN